MVFRRLRFLIRNAGVEAFTLIRRGISDREHCRDNKREDGMASEFVGIPDQLMRKVKETADREEITVEELVRDALEQRINGKQFSRLFAIGDRNVKRTGAKPRDVETEIAAHRSERGGK